MAKRPVLLFMHLKNAKKMQSRAARGIPGINKGCFYFRWRKCFLFPASGAYGRFKKTFS
ncbi:MAG: hypothetical protein ACTTJV_04040 [Ottowia sp.]